MPLIVHQLVGVPGCGKTTQAELLCGAKSGLEEILTNDKDHKESESPLNLKESPFRRLFDAGNAHRSGENVIESLTRAIRDAVSEVEKLSKQESEKLSKEGKEGDVITGELWVVFARGDFGVRNIWQVSVQEGALCGMVGFLSIDLETSKLRMVERGREKDDSERAQRAWDAYGSVLEAEMAAEDIASAVFTVNAVKLSAAEVHAALRKAADEFIPLNRDSDALQRANAEAFARTQAEKARSRMEARAAAAAAAAVPSLDSRPRSNSRERPAGRGTRTLFVCGLPADTTAKELGEWLEAEAKIRLMQVTVPARSSGTSDVAFVAFESEDDVDALLQLPLRFRGSIILKMEPARPGSRASSSRGRGRRGRR